MQMKRKNTQKRHRRSHSIPFVHVCVYERPELVHVRATAAAAAAATKCVVSEVGFIYRYIKIIRAYRENAIEVKLTSMA